MSHILFLTRPSSSSSSSSYYPSFSSSAFDLGKLGNVEQLPIQENVDNFAKDNSKFIGLNSLKKHTFAKEFLKTNDTESAWKVLLIK